MRMLRQIKIKKCQKYMWRRMKEKDKEKAI
jgi:hypothetical protein